MTRASPGGKINIDSRVHGGGLHRFTQDPDDEHVCALALEAAPCVLVSDDRGFLRRALTTQGVRVRTPDEFLCELFESEPGVVEDGLGITLQQWQAGAHSSELFAALSRSGAKRFAHRAAMEADL